MTDIRNPLRDETVIGTDFLGIYTDTGLVATNNGTAAASALIATPEGANPGIVQSTTGTTTTGYSFMSDGAAQLYMGTTSGEMVLEALVRLPVLSTVGEEYSVAVGFGETATTHDQVDGVYFYYDRVNDGTNWMCATSSNSTRTETDSNVAIVAATWYRLKVALTATTAYFYINDVAVASTTTNIPNAAARAFGRVFGIVKSAGSTARVLDTDYIWTKVVPASNR